PDSLALLDAGDERRLAGLRVKLLARRAERVRPGWDDQALADWNGLLIAALARAAQAFGRPAWLGLATSAFDFVTTRMTEGDRLWHSWRNGKAKPPATASDYANMIWAAVRLHEATNEGGYLNWAQRFAGVLDRHYWTEAGGYATSADD